MEHILPLSVIFLTHNEEFNVERALKSVAGWVGEVCIVDSGSTDNTLEIAGRHTDKIVYHPFDNYAQQRNWAQDNLPLLYDWIFHVDADEYVTPELRTALECFFRSDAVETTDGLLLRRRTVFMGRWIRHGGHYPSYHLRVFRRQKGRCEDRFYDQHFVVSGTIRRLNGGDLIDPVMSDLDTWLMRHVRWADLEARELANQRTKLTSGTTIKTRFAGTPIERKRWMRVSIYNRLPLFGRALAYFLYRYFLRLGFLDGPEGLIFHVLQGFWFRFYVDTKLWEMRHVKGLRNDKNI